MVETSAKNNEDGTQLKAFKAKANIKRDRISRLADNLSSYFGSTAFLILNFGIFLFWILANNDLIPNILPFDRFPYVFLTTAVSLEAIFLTIFVLISQNRQTQIADLREEVALQIGLKSHEQNTKILKMLESIEKKLRIYHGEDKELKSMEHKVDENRILQQLKKEIEED